MNKIVDSLSAN